jgi:hypothetical protein
MDEFMINKLRKASEIILFRMISIIFTLIHPILFRFYHIKWAKSKDEFEKIFKFRYKVYNVDLHAAHIKKYLSQKLHDDEMIYDDLDFSEESINIYATRKGKIIGAIRLSFWDKKNINQEKISFYSITEEFLKKRAQCAEFSFFITENKSRGGILSMVLLAALVNFSQRIHKLPSDIFGYCMPGLLDKYEMLGAYMYSNELVYDEDGISVKIVINPFIKKKLLEMNNDTQIFHYYAKYLFWKERRRLAHEEKSVYLRKNTGELSRFIMNNKDIIESSLITEKSDKQLSHFILNKIDTAKSHIFDVKAGKDIIIEDIRDRHLYLILEGSFQALCNNNKICELGVGDIFGELEMIRHIDKRTFSIQSISPGKILLINHSFKKGLDKESLEEFHKLAMREFMKKIHLFIKNKV